MEKLFYEFKPLICFAMGVYALVISSSSQLMISCGIALIFSSAYIANLRIKYRRSHQVRRIRR